jgi:methionyl-tRNA synthetase
MLKAEGSYILPDNVPANEFLNLEGNKLSTSKMGGLVARIFGRFPGQQDVLRYALTSNAPKLRIMILLGKIFKRETTMSGYLR